MRKLTIHEHISLDGVIQQSADDCNFPYGNWSVPYRTPAGREAILAAYGERFDLVLGRRTYDMWSDSWPHAPSSPMADRLNAATKCIATHRPESLSWGPFVCLGPDIVEGIRRIKAQDGPDLILAGSSTLTSTLLEHGLADDVVLVVSPVLLGTGKRSLQKEPRHALSSSSARRQRRPASSSVRTRWPGLCRPDRGRRTSNNERGDVCAGSTRRFSDRFCDDPSVAQGYDCGEPWRACTSMASCISSTAQGSDRSALGARMRMVCVVPGRRSCVLFAASSRRTRCSALPPDSRLLKVRLACCPGLIR